NEEEDLTASSHGVFDEIPSSKLRTPKKSRHRNTKIQAPNTQEIPNSKLQTLARASSLELGAWSFSGVWILGVGFSLDFGVWCLELFKVLFWPDVPSPSSSIRPP